MCGDILGIQWRLNDMRYTIIQIHAMMRLYLGAPVWIGQTRLNDNDLHPRISSQPLIKDEMSNPVATPKFSYLYACSSTKNVLFDVWSY